MSFGMYNHSIDSKNRFIIPAQLRSELGDRIILFRSPDESKCIYVYTEERWEEICREIDNLPPSASSRHLQRALLHAAIPVELDKTGRVIYVSSLSKILAPGLRIGYVVAGGELVDKIEIMKQVNDVHTPCLTQMIATEFLKKYDVEAHIKKACEVYGRKCAFMLDCMEKYFPKSVEWTKPNGGLFILVTCPDSINAEELSLEAVKNYKVAFVPSSNFATDMSKPTSSFRLNYSMMPEEKIEIGIKAIGDMLKAKLGE